MKLRRPAEPGVLARARQRLEPELAALAAAWTTGPFQIPEPDAVLQNPGIADALFEMTDGNCAYCERSLSAGDRPYWVVTHHRPTWGAVGGDGQVDMTAYWWLIYDWDNLLPVCRDCVRSKGTRFPVDGARANSVDDLPGELPSLLDPVRDDPAEHLRYDADGTVQALTERGRVTCEVLALNRDPLVHDRQTVLRANDPSETAFPTMRTQMAASRLDAVWKQPQGLGFLTDRLRPGGSSLGLIEEAFVGGPPPAPPLGPTVSAEPPSYDLSAAMDGTGRGKYFTATRWIERVVIKNFRPIRDLDLNLARSASDRGPWTVLLGENGSGKSSILHAVALTLMGGEQRRALGIDARTYLRYRARKGLVQVYLSGQTEPFELRWSSGDAEFTGPEPVPALLLGYGATRLLPRAHDGATDSRAVRVDNLFNPLLPITDPTTWLLSLDDDTFADVAQGIHGLLALGVTDELVRTRRQVRLRQGRAESDIAGLSDGYQSMVVMACDILRSVLTLWPRAALAEGIVLVDEVGAHLHPRWRMRVVGALRALLPRVQFIISTHDPLCLRGVLDGEVVVVRRNHDGDVVTIVDLPPVTGMRIDQLLTSEHFGLGSTDDPEVADLWETYYSLQGLSRPTVEQTAHLERVRARLGELEQFGTTERDRLLLTAAADYIAKRRETGDTVASPTAEVTAELSQLWAKHLPAEQP
ncbi:MAG TPA: AAA family ATPase [Arachnia sp.]|nr:AAA family ATPase [Arachnia sp.]HMT87436.1 AAA family ATPase [Arachnia sp.]